MQMLISLFTTGGKINPIAMLLFVGVSIIPIQRLSRLPRAGKN